VHTFCHYRLLDIVYVDVVEGRIEKKDYEDFNLDEMAADETTENSSHEALFHFIAECITKFKDNRIGKKLPTCTAFTFPFHESFTSDSGRLIRWVGEFKPDVVEPLNLGALVNDTTGILLAMGNKEPDCHIGLSVRNGSNACYMEELDARDCKVIINTEWGALGDDNKLDKWRTDYDRDDENLVQGRVDSNGDQPGNLEPEQQL
jgi:hexokinase